MQTNESVLAELDDLLRGAKTSPEALERGAYGIDPALMAKAALALGALYGVFMGLYGAINHSPAQIGASMLKVPLLFALSAAVTFPSLYVFTALAGGRQGLATLLRVVAAAVAVNAAVLASLGPITGFFTLTTTSYPFMKLLNTLFFGIAGAVALEFLRRALLRLEPLPEAGVKRLAADVPRPSSTGTLQQVFMLWLGLYVFVSVQAGWLLRPLVGDPQAPFRWFSPIGGSALADFARSFTTLTGG